MVKDYPKQKTYSLFSFENSTQPEKRFEFESNLADLVVEQSKWFIIDYSGHKIFGGGSTRTFEFDFHIKYEPEVD